MKNVFIKFLLLGVMLFVTINSFAINWFVKSNGNGLGNSWNNATSLHNACLQANDGDIIFIATGEYDINKTINIKKSISIIGGFKGNEEKMDVPDVKNNKVVLNGRNNRCFVINSKTGSEKITISGLEFNNFNPQGKNHGGAIFINYASSDINFNDLIFNNCIVTEKYEDSPNAGANGGAIYINSFNKKIKLNFNNCIFNACKSYSGGAIFVNNGNSNLGKDIKINNCIFKNNTSITNGGALYIRIGNNVNISNSLFNANIASIEDLKGSGGAIFLQMNNNVTIEYSTFFKNVASQKGSVIYGNGKNDENKNIVNIKNSVLINNNATRSNTGRFAVDADNIGTNNIYILTNSIVANNTNTKNGIADMIIIKPSDKNVIKNSILNCAYYSNTTAESLKSSGRYKAYLTEEQIVELLKDRGVKDPSKYKKNKE